MMFFFQTEIIKWYHTIGFVIPAAVCLISAVYNQMKQVRQTKNTVSINICLFLFLMVGGFCFALSSALQLIDVITQDKEVYGPLVGLIPNCITFSMSTYMFSVKMKNWLNAKSLGISEQEYFDSVISKQMASSLSKQ